MPEELLREPFEHECSLRYAPYQYFNHDAFLKSLRNLDFGNPKWMYDATSRDDAPLQGDILPAVELHWTDSNGEALQWIGPAMLLSNSCDLVPEQDPAAAMAPVFPIDEFVDRFAPPQRERERSAIQTNQHTSRMYLPGASFLSESYVDFAWSSAVSTQRIATLFTSAGRKNILRLTEAAWYLLTGKLAHHYVREQR